MDDHSEAEALQRVQDELIRCKLSPAYFINAHCKIYDNVTTRWLPFTLWPEQTRSLEVIDRERLVVILKARQLGMSWLCLGYILHSMIFRPIAKPLVFSRTEEDAMYLLGDERLRGMFKQLPDWMKQIMDATSVGDASRTWELTNGSVAHAFPPNRGDSYTGTIALADEFDLLTAKEQSQLLRSVKPTVDAGAKFIMLSRVDKQNTDSVFKKTFVGAEAGKNGWAPIFLSCFARPDRDEAWYERQEQEAQSFESPKDYLWEQYPRSSAEALAPKALDKRIPAEWLLQCYEAMEPLDDYDGPALGGLEVYRVPEPGRRYIAAGDPAEGNPSSDHSALAVLDAVTGEEVAAMAGLYQPAVFAEYLDEIGKWYNNAALLVERNNHGAAVILWLQEHSELELLCGIDGKPGWLTTNKSKAIMYAACAMAFRDKTVTLHSFATYNQLASIDGNKLEAPKPLKDDRATSFALAVVAPAESVYETRGLTSVG